MLTLYANTDVETEVEWQDGSVGESYVLTVEGVYSLMATNRCCLLYTSDAADERSSVDLGGRRIIKKKKNKGW